MLIFTDNRQDASLQAGHFNDFIEVGLLRSALYQAEAESGVEGLRYDNLNQKVFQALNLPVDQYAQDPNVKYHARQETDLALREILRYRLYRDLKRGWRITQPNLEQYGLLEIHCLSLEEFFRDEGEWSSCHEALATATPEQRHHAAKVLLDHIRRELVIKVPYLDFTYFAWFRAARLFHWRKRTFSFPV